MNERIKKVVIFAIFILVLLLFSFTAFFSESLLWPNSSVNREFDGILFNNSDGVDDFRVTRAVVNREGQKLIKYDLKFSYKGEDSTARILGIPARQVFFDEGINYKNSNVKLKGDFDKVNESLFKEKLRLKHFYSKIDNKEYQAVSEVKLNLTEKIEDYNFSIYYVPNPLYFSGGQLVENTSVFVTNAKVSDWQESTKTTDSIKEAFNNSGYYINKLELINEKIVSKISTINTVTTILFLVLALATIALIWIGKGNLMIYLAALFVMIPSFYRFIGKGTSTWGIILIYPLLAFIASLVAKLLANNSEKKLTTNDFKQSLAFTILFFVICIIIFIIPRTFI